MIFESVILGSILLFSIPLFIPTWKWYWISSALIAIPLFTLWTQYFYSIYQPSYRDSPGEGLGLFIFGVPALCFLIGMFSRYLRWIIQIKIDELKIKNAGRKSI